MQASCAPSSAPRSVSVVIPVRDGEVQLMAGLECVWPMNPAPIECVVVDDGPLDCSTHIARQANCRVLSAGGRRGPASARNLGAHAARGDLLLFLDADVLAPPDLVACVLDAFQREPDLDALIGSCDDVPADRLHLSVSEPPALLHSPDQLRGGLDLLVGLRGRPPRCLSALWRFSGALPAALHRGHQFGRTHAPPQRPDPPHEGS